MEYILKLASEHLPPPPMEIKFLPEPALTGHQLWLLRCARRKYGDN